ncbi:hypothetical protein L208DRAFT_327443 [Tricholoma matsutake]|nr:hypothetical protein L208DRAFT_327443 [Tricholoma matsutake 945]
MVRHNRRINLEKKKCRSLLTDPRRLHFKSSILQIIHAMLKGWHPGESLVPQQTRTRHRPIRNDSLPIHRPRSPRRPRQVFTPHNSHFCSLPYLTEGRPCGSILAGKDGKSGIRGILFYLSRRKCGRAIRCLRRRRGLGLGGEMRMRVLGLSF